MHPQTKRLKFNILLTTYEILLKDKVITCTSLGRWNRLSGVELLLDLHTFWFLVIKCESGMMDFAFLTCNSAPVLST